MNTELKKKCRLMRKKIYELIVFFLIIFFIVHFPSLSRFLEYKLCDEQFHHKCLCKHQESIIKIKTRKFGF